MTHLSANVTYTLYWCVPCQCDVKRGKETLQHTGHKLVPHAKGDFLMKTWTRGDNGIQAWCRHNASRWEAILNHQESAWWVINERGGLEGPRFVTVKRAQDYILSHAPIA